MKKSLSLILSLVIIITTLAVLPFSASALPESGILDENTAYSFEPVLGELTIYGSSSIATRNFNTDSKPSPFKDNTEIKKVVIRGALGIGSCTFYGCTNLKEVTFTSENTKIIEYSAFQGCTALETVNFDRTGTGITTIYSGAFSGCSSLKRINLPVTVNMIDSSAFKDCSSLQSVYIPNTDCLFSSSVFENCTSLTSFSMPLNSGCVNYDMFKNCTSLTKLAIPYVPSYTFYDNALNGCTALTDIYFCGTQQQWSVYARPGNNPLNSAAVHYNCRYGRCGDDAEFVYDIANKELTISGTGVTYGNKFDGGPKGSDTLWYPYKDDIESVVIEEGITGIGWYNFIDESNLKSITVPKSLEGVAIYAFKNCTALTDIYYAGTESEWSSLGNFTATGNSALDTATKHYSYCNHNYSSSVTEPTCTEKGYTTYTCSNCGDSYVDDSSYTNALGHDFSSNAEYCRNNCGAKNPNYVAPQNPSDNTGDGGNTGNTNSQQGGIQSSSASDNQSAAPAASDSAASTAAAAKKANTVIVKAKTVTVKAKDIKKKNKTFAQKKAFTVSKAQGKVTYKKSSGNKKITVSSAGKITVKKGLKKGTYKVKVKVTAAGNNTYKKTTKTVTVTIKVK